MAFKAKIYNILKPTLILLLVFYCQIKLQLLWMIKFQYIFIWFVCFCYLLIDLRPLFLQSPHHLNVPFCLVPEEHLALNPTQKLAISLRTDLTLAVLDIFIPIIYKTSNQIEQFYIFFLDLKNYILLNKISHCVLFLYVSLILYQGLTFTISNLPQLVISSWDSFTNVTLLGVILPVKMFYNSFQSCFNMRLMNWKK